jgi:biotin synthase
MNSECKIRNNWNYNEAWQLFSQPFGDLIYQSHKVLTEYFNPNQIQISSLLSLKTGACTENCSYCSQSSHHKTKTQPSTLMDISEVLKTAVEAKKAGVKRLCMASSGREPDTTDWNKILEMVKEVKKLGLQTCLTLGLLDSRQAQELKNAGLDYYNHNIDTAEDYYGQITTTHSFQDRITTLDNVRNADIKICSGGIIGMGETNDNRIKMLLTLANMPKHPQSVPINLLVPIKGTPLEKIEKPDIFDFVRTISLARIMMPASYVRLSAGRNTMSDELQALCFFAGANSIFYGETLLTTENQKPGHDTDLLKRLGIRPV